ncbi:DoxX family protein [Aeromicrobium sp. SMF47]|uniref:DoxX family protein n=1 Tax=Aeromicrobium yanjiei TaxID=2662028 RepID=A0A5Q2ML15_9ACTN|nr:MULTISPECIES: DoxX family protein [Aeromicrobium]MRJ77872.1 DoxX family protein [Aeromicrobium yanjiei]MRK02234.1 DoxX family protein [Aeromicrobium sp. S22]QGG41045.1 DoxX family protein [Aeromicrobium yanjiei]
MEIAYWIVAGLLALMYLYSGGIKLVQSQEKLAPMMAWAGTAVPMSGVRAIGLLEVLGAVGLILPPLVDVVPVLALVAAIGLLVLQLLAGLFHLSRHETKDIWLNVTLVVAAAVTVWLATAVWS